MPDAARGAAYHGRRTTCPEDETSATQRVRVPRARPPHFRRRLSNKAAISRVDAERSRAKYSRAQPAQREHSMLGTLRRSALLMSCAGLFSAGAVHAATPASGTLTDLSGPITYSAGPFTVANPTPVPLLDSGPECNNPVQPCDDFSLTVSLPADYAVNHPNDKIQVKLGWTDSGTGRSDYDLYVF